MQTADKDSTAPTWEHTSPRRAIQSQCTARTFPLCSVMIQEEVALYVLGRSCSPVGMTEAPACHGGGFRACDERVLLGRAVSTAPYTSIAIHVTPAGSEGLRVNYKASSVLEPQLVLGLALVAFACSRLIRSSSVVAKDSD